MEYERVIGSRLARDTADASLIGRMRLLLAVSAMLTVFIEPDASGQHTPFTWMVFGGYTVLSAVLYLLSQMDQPFAHSKAIYWLDVCWYALIVYCTGGNNSFFFLFFFFAILTASFHFGFEEGARITLASAALFTTTVLVIPTEAEVSRLLLRTTFLLGLGYMIAYWGGMGLAHKRRLALMHDVSKLSNPRFGVDHTLNSVLDKTRAFFSASGCLLVMRDTASAAWTLRTSGSQLSGTASKATSISAAAATPLLAFAPDQIVVYTRPLNALMAWSGESRTLTLGQSRWIKRGGDPGESLAELLDARSFISAPLPLRKGEGRIYVMSQRHSLSKTDALFLSHIGAQVFPMIENIELLDRLASEAVLRERQKIARDLHDSTIQPYIGLRHGLSALRNKAGADNPLIADLDKLIAMSTLVLGDMRRYARGFKSGLQQSEPELLVALRRQAAQVKDFYGIGITVSSAGGLDISDRLAAEVFQIVNEGMSNIRKHTSAREGAVTLGCADGWLNIRIENECPAGPAEVFLPHSIAERAAALGGKAHVEHKADGDTVVLVAIPV